MDEDRDTTAPSAANGAAMGPVAASSTSAAAVRLKKPNYRQRFVISGHTRSISSLKYSPDGSTLASSGMSCLRE